MREHRHVLALLLLAGFAVSAFGDEPAPPKADWATVALLRFDSLPLRNAASTAVDVRGEGLSLVEGRFGKAADFSKGGRAHFVVPAKAAPERGFTIECWINLRSTGGDSLQRLVGVSNRYGLYVSGRGKPKVSFYVKPVGGKWRSVSAPVFPGEWTHVAGVYDGEAMTLYLGGRPVQRAPNPGRLRPAPATFCVGSELRKDTHRFQGLLDEVRFSRVARKAFGAAAEIALPKPPTSVVALDLGPEDSAVMEGFRRLSPKTSYSPKLGYGWTLWKPADWKNPAVGGMSPDPLWADHIMVSGNRTRLRVDAPDGEYGLWFWSGRWGAHPWGLPTVAGFGFRADDGGAVRHKTDFPRYLHENFGRRLDALDHPRADFYRDWVEGAFRRFSGVVTAKKGRLLLAPVGRFAVNGIVLCAVKDRAATERWLTALAARRRAMFRCEDATPPVPTDFTPSPEQARRGLVLFVPQRETLFYPTSVPTARAPRATALTAFACRGETEPINLAVRPLRDFRNVRARMTDLSGPGGSRLGGPDIQAFQVQMLPRGSGTSSFAYQGYLLRAAAPRELRAGRTEHYWWNLRTPPNVPPGLYRGEVILESVRGRGRRREVVEMARLPVRLRVLEMDLLSSDATGVKLMVPYSTFNGFHWKRDWRLMEPSYRADMRFMKACGLNCGMILGGRELVSGWRPGEWPPLAKLEGLSRQWRICKEIGFRQVFCYPFQHLTGIAWGTADRNRFARQLGDSYLGPKHRAAIRRVVETLTRFERERELPTLIVSIMDEAICHGGKKTLPAYTKMVEFFADMKKEYGLRHAVLDSSRDVDGFVKGLDICAPNRKGTPENFAKMKAVGAEIWLYNTGLRRFQMGFYCWRAGLKGLWVWHYCHGSDTQLFPFGVRGSLAYQTARGPIATVNSQWVREGIDDLRYLKTLEAYIRRGLNSGKPGARDAARAGKAMLDELRSRMTVDFFHYVVNRPDGSPAPGAWAPSTLNVLRWRAARHAVAIARVLGD